jgi:hypothetical protein
MAYRSSPGVAAGRDGAGRIRRWPADRLQRVTDDEPDAVPIQEILDRIPGARARTREGLDQARRGEGVPLDALADAPPDEHAR